MSETAERLGRGRWGARIGGGFTALVGLLLVAGGVKLAALGGSLYYAIAGAGVLLSGILVMTRRPAGALVYGLVLLGTVGWALWEAGFAFWPLLPRLFAPAVLGVVVFLAVMGQAGARKGWSLGATALGVVVSLGLLAAAIPATYAQGQAATAAPVKGPGPAAGGDWRAYGRDGAGQRYAPFDQIDGTNVEKLKVAWTAHTGEKSLKGSEDQNTPLQVGDTVYLCTPTNVVIAVDADTGKERWRHDPKVKAHFWNRCRGVGYYETAAAKTATLPKASGGAPAGLCERRILSSTIDARLFALDAATGQPCPGFGQGGVVDLKQGMGPVKPGFYFQSSTPTVARDRVIIGGWVADNQELGEPSGVVRAFSAETGQLVWAWDLGNPAITAAPPPGGTYTRGTPNVWSTPAFDEAAGLVFLPTGNATPDYWGSHRSKESEAYASSVVALDIETGRERWHFQTTHHDLWDYDVPSQPMLVDFPAPAGPKPAVVQLTKRGQVFVLDRATGQPLATVEEKPVPQQAAKGEWTSATQPYSTGMPTVGAFRLAEKMMWGATPLDQLVCRISFKSMRYDGDFTPPGVDGKPALQFPGNGGGMNWGSGAYDAKRGLLLTTDIRNPQGVVLKPWKNPVGGMAPDRPAQSQGAVLYKAKNDWLIGPMFIPCLQPPNGVMTAIDLSTRKVVWQVPLGTARNSGPFGLPSRLPIPLGTFGLGGPVATAGGLVFHASTTDPYLRAYDAGTGRKAWEARLPAGVGGTPMTYVSPKTGKQYVVVSAGGARLGQGKGDDVIAFALPN